MAVIEQPQNTPEAWSARATHEASSWDAAGWTRAGQRDRFAKVLEALAPTAGEKLLDFGCGTGALADLLPSDVDYVGFDTAPGMIVRAAREHHGRRFQSWDPGGTFDLVACVGPFNLADRWSKLHTWWTLRRLWEMTGRALAVSLYAGDDARCLRYSLSEVQEWACGESYRWRVEKWRSNDILAVVSR